MTSTPVQSASDSASTPERSIPLVALRRPTIDASSSASLSSAPTTSPSTPSSLTPPTSAHDSSSSSSPASPDRLSRQTTYVSGTPAPSIHCPDLSLSPHQSPSQPQTAAPQSVPDSPGPQNPPQRQDTWLSFLPPYDHRRTWLQNSIGIAALAVALVGMFVYALRGYKMAKWTEYNDLLQSCAALIQANQDGGPLCKKVLADGPRERPYDKRHVLSSVMGQLHHLSKRMYGIQASKTDNGVRPDSAGTSFRWGLPLAFAILFGAATLLLFHLRRTSRTETVFQSPARTEGSTIRHLHPDGYSEEDHTGPVEIEKRQPGLGSILKHRMKQKAHDKKTHIKSKVSWSSASANSSAATLVGDGEEGHGEHDEHHDGLIELKQTNETRNFWIPETGETLHLAPWKSTHDSSEEDEEQEPFEKLEKGTIQRKLTEMSIGSAILGGGKAAETSLHEKAQAEKRKQSQQMGDSLAGLVSNEPASIKDAFK
ncbi:MAG: hypothetical protein Q9195_009611 [Heterodermia aff. obscurata]